MSMKIGLARLHDDVLHCHAAVSNQAVDAGQYTNAPGMPQAGGQ